MSDTTTTTETPTPSGFQMIEPEYRFTVVEATKLDRLGTPNMPGQELLRQIVNTITVQIIAYDPVSKLSATRRQVVTLDLTNIDPATFKPITEIVSDEANLQAMWDKQAANEEIEGSPLVKHLEDELIAMIEEQINDALVPIPPLPKVRPVKLPWTVNITDEMRQRAAAMNRG